MTTRYALVSIDTARYGYVISMHRTRAAAEDELERISRSARRRHRDALVHLMYDIVAVETGIRVGARILRDRTEPDDWTPAKLDEMTADDKT